MTDVYIQKKLTELFFTLNEVSGVEFINADNVALPNKIFKVPANKRFFSLFFMNNEPTPLGNGAEAQDFYTGVFQIDICTPLNKGEDEADVKFDWISKIFSRGRFYEGIDIKRCYRTQRKSEDDFYRTPIRVEWEAYIDKQEL